MQNYVCGFLFNEDLTKVVLIRKNKPEWQRGKLNGVGGKIEVKESSQHAMSREFLEEAGVFIDHWNFLCSESDENWYVDFYCAKENLAGVSTMEDEQVEIHKVSTLTTEQMISNLRDLISKAQKMLENA